MFCYQCEQVAGGKSCTQVGVCGKNIEFVLKCGAMNIKAMEILDKAHTAKLGNPVPTPPAFISNNVFSVLQKNFDLRLIGDPKKDLEVSLSKCQEDDVLCEVGA